MSATKTTARIEFSASRDEALADRNELHATVRKLNCDNADEFWAVIGRLRARAETAEARADAAEATVERLRAAQEAMIEAIEAGNLRPSLYRIAAGRA